MKFLTDIDFKHKRVLIRTDYNVPVHGGQIVDDARIRLSLPTIKHVSRQADSKIVIISHFGRPGGKRDPSYSLRPVAKKLEDMLEKSVVFIDDIASREGQTIAKNLGSGEIALAENLRFYPEEEANDEQFAIDLCHAFAVFVYDAFSVSHRAHASIASIPKFKPSCAGLQLEKEIKELSQALRPQKRPAIAIIGGAKIETKIPIIENLAKHYDVVLLGGKIAVEANEKKLAFSGNVVLPDDYAPGNFDIGPKTCEKFSEIIRAASYIVWNGPMGKFEEEKYSVGTKAMLGAMSRSDSYKIAGGGETIEFINLNGAAGSFDFISSGGGAMLEFLSGKNLPGIAALEENL